MAYYKSGYDFEKAVFGCRSHREFLEGLGSSKAGFAEDLKEIIRSATTKHPPTQIGECLYRQVARQLGSLDVDPEGLVFLSSVNTQADVSHGTDGFFFLPSLFPHLVTVDTFNMEPMEFLSWEELRELWIQSFTGEFYSESDFQSDLFLFKSGVSEWKAVNRRLPSDFFPSRPPDFRRFAIRGREENHFVLTPYHVSTYQQRKEFARMVAGYFAKVSRHEMAKQSH